MLLLLCGRPFSGKSTLARRLAETRGAAVVSLDAINLERGLRGGEGLSVEEWARTLQEGKRRTRRMLREHPLVVVDDTLCFRWIRDELRALAASAGARAHLVHLDPPPAVLQERMRANEACARRPGLALAVLEEHLRTFEDPAPEEHPVLLRTPEEIEAWLGSL